MTAARIRKITGNAVTVVGDEEDVKFWQQGSSSLYSEEALRQRAAVLVIGALLLAFA